MKPPVADPDGLEPSHANLKTAREKEERARSAATAKFPRGQLVEAFTTNLARLRGENVKEHPLSVAAANSTDPDWRGSLIANAGVVVNSAKDVVGPPADLSE